MPKPIAAARADKPDNADDKRVDFLSQYSLKEFKRKAKRYAKDAFAKSADDAALAERNIEAVMKFMKSVLNDHSTAAESCDEQRWLEVMYAVVYTTAGVSMSMGFLYYLWDAPLTELEDQLRAAFGDHSDFAAKNIKRTNRLHVALTLDNGIERGARSYPHSVRDKSNLPKLGRVLKTVHFRFSVDKKLLAYYPDRAGTAEYFKTAAVYYDDATNAAIKKHIDENQASSRVANGLGCIRFYIV